VTGQPGLLGAVAFDLDGTLADFVRFKRIATDQAALAMVDAGLAMPPALAMERLWEAYRAAGLDGDQGFDRFLQDTVGHAEPRLLAAAIQAYLRAKDAALEPYPRTTDTLVALVRRGLRLAVITDAERRKALQRLAALRLLPFFDNIITLDDTLSGKADDQPYRMLLRQLDLPPRSVLMVGDNPARDVRPARTAGLWTALARYGAQPQYLTALPEDRPDFTLERIEDLVRVVDHLQRGTPPPHADAAFRGLAARARAGAAEA